jgi:hypothetical protein
VRAFAAAVADDVAGHHQVEGLQIAVLEVAER